MKLGFGWKSAIAASEWGRLREGRPRTSGRAASSSAASLAKPGRRTVRGRFLNTGTALERTGRRSRRKDAKSLVTGLNSSISGSTSSSAARRLTKVVLPWRKTWGTSSSVRLRATFSLAIAPKAGVALEVALESSAPRRGAAGGGLVG